MNLETRKPGEVQLWSQRRFLASWLPNSFFLAGRTGTNREKGKAAVAPSPVDGFRCVSLQLPPRDSSTPLRAAQNDGPTFLRSCFRYFIFLFVPCCLLCSCKREQRLIRVEPPAANKLQTNSESDLYPGGRKPPAPVANPYENNAFAVNEGQKLFSSFNCAGCHFHGGGGIGPPLMDNKWAYGSEPNQIFASIVEGRPNGMPSFRGKIPNYQVWQLVAYVRTLGGLGNPNAAPGRNDEMNNTQPPNSAPNQTPQNSALPPSTQMPPP